MSQRISLSGKNVTKHSNLAFCTAEGISSLTIKKKKNKQTSIRHHSIIHQLNDYEENLLCTRLIRERLKFNPDNDELLTTITE